MSVSSFGLGRLLLICPLVAMLVFACAPDGDGASSGNVSLGFDGSSDSAFFFVLKNGTSHIIKFRGWMRPQGDPTPTYSGSCSASSESGHSTSGFVGSFYDHSRPKAIAVSPGESLKLAIESIEFDQFKGRHCTLTIQLEDGSSVNSSSFDP